MRKVRDSCLLHADWLITPGTAGVPWRRILCSSVRGRKKTLNTRGWAVKNVRILLEKGGEKKALPLCFSERVCFLCEKGGESLYSFGGGSFCSHGKGSMFLLLEG